MPLYNFSYRPSDSDPWELYRVNATYAADINALAQGQVDAASVDSGTVRVADLDGALLGLYVRGAGISPATMTALVATTSPVAMVATGETIICQLAAPGPVAVTLPAAPTLGQTHTIKDGTGDAGLNHITITPSAGTIDGQATAVIAVNYGSLSVVYNGVEWDII